RSAELRQHMPVLRDACALIHRDTSAQFVLAAAPIHGHADHAQLLREGWPAEIAPRIVQGRTYDALAAADTATVSRAPATVETALLDVPMVVVYRVTPLTAFLAKPLVRTPFFSMVNLIADDRVVPELIQSDFTPARVSQEVVALLRDSSKRASMRA